MDIDKIIEQYYPLFWSVLLTILLGWLNQMMGLNINLLNMIEGLRTSTLLGFYNAGMMLITLLLLTKVDNKNIDFIKKIGRYNLLIDYIISSIKWLIVLALISVVSIYLAIFANVPLLHNIFLLLYFFCVFISLLSYYRAIRFIVLMLRIYGDH